MTEQELAENEMRCVHCPAIITKVRPKFSCPKCGCEYEYKGNGNVLNYKFTVHKKVDENKRKLYRYVNSKPLTELEMKTLFTKEEIKALITECVVWKHKADSAITYYFLY